VENPLERDLVVPVAEYGFVPVFDILDHELHARVLGQKEIDMVAENPVDVVARFERLVGATKEVVETADGKVVGKALHPLDAAKELDGTHFVVERSVSFDGVLRMHMEANV